MGKPPIRQKKKKKLGLRKEHREKQAIQSNGIRSDLYAGSQLDANKKAMSIKCKVCLQTFISTTSEVQCREHAEAKHPKSDVEACFPHLKK